MDIDLRLPRVKELEEKLDAIKNHVNNFQYDWITGKDIADWYGTLQKIIQASGDSTQ